ncbi:UDP-N-acetylmuramoyl-tripeptide--D-alanyl-D-alanine ligase [Polaribacter sp. BM10]|uniref:UDP-N-acetylmuramoyl-tripeptide--D-alanyl-D- alanine ligase n=1 Tax=Polaribacter sp. BM10 TaxID=1529069 RepID=UPI000989BE9B|nr:UDP-N-acetylmuramoyl-tripeptide--D-alanyl-D-alanine ligase [Polaribacter sp. BM10]AQS95126.1 UDP-N-acetylmuramoyl-tripeptide--D-alanyl-D-alanine ligase [Polaribacter sp. BM10]
MNITEIYKLYSKHYLVDTDTRKIRENTLFFALKGANFNGNKFAAEAIKKGASFAIIDEEEYHNNKTTILVTNVLETLQDLARHHRKQLKATIIALTGSNGKTTTKELINVVLSKKYNTKATRGNLNNHIGVPLTLLSFTPDVEMGIVEMGANHQKEIEFLCSIANPDYGYITNFGKAHLEGFGGVEGIIKGKSELYDYLKKNNKTVFINTDDELQVQKTNGCNTIHFNNSIKLIDASPFVKLSFNSNIITTNLIGSYNYNNIAVAITIGNYFKVLEADIQSAIEKYTPTNNRSQIIDKDSNYIILDAYNANPSSMKVALENFVRLESKFKTVILGDMFELGSSAEIEHQYIVDLADSFNFENTFYVGENFYKTTTKNKKLISFSELEDFIKKNPLENQKILIKGSRGMGLERILNFID